MQSTRGTRATGFWLFLYGLEGAKRPAERGLRAMRIEASKLSKRLSRLSPLPSPTWQSARL